MSVKAKKEAYDMLKSLDVNVLTNNLVKNYQEGSVILDNGRQIRTKTLISTSGVIAKKVEGLSDEVLGRGRRIKVDEINRVYETENVFCIGNQCLQTTYRYFPEGHSQLAQVAIQQGELLAKNLIWVSNKESVKGFKYYYRGSMAIISKFNAVVDLPNISFKEVLAWLAWLFIHIIPLVSFSNRLKIAFNWMLSFTSNNPSLRLLVAKKKFKIN